MDLDAGTTYQIDLEGAEHRAWQPAWDPYLRGVRNDLDGDIFTGKANNDGGEGRNSRVEFTAPADGTYYVAAGGDLSDPGTGTYTLSVEGHVMRDAATAGSRRALRHRRRGYSAGRIARVPTTIRHGPAADGFTATTGPGAPGTLPLAESWQSGIRRHLRRQWAVRAMFPLDSGRRR